MGPMASLRLPSPGKIDAFVRSQSALGFTYGAVGATAATPPPGYVVDHNRVRLGEGEAVFRAARSALERWAHFDLGWLKAHPCGHPIERGQTVGVLARNMGLWWLMACRIVYVIDDAGGPDDDGRTPRRFGFAYGTLPAHAETGEERFMIEWDRHDDGVWYDILAFSRPNGLLFRLGNRRLRALQNRFARDSKAAMIDAARPTD